MITRSSVLTWSSLLATVAAQSVLTELSFGHAGTLAPGGEKIPGWTISTTGHNPHILSDRVALTTIHPANTRGALWADNSISAERWTADLDFRVSGGEHAAGNLGLWYVHDKATVEQNNIYTVGNFDGLAIIIDQYGGQGGSVRGFLNDGSQSFSTLANLDSLAFGHCEYSYRNLGRPSRLRISNHDGLSVHIDDKLCFSSDQIVIPPNYRFGITAGTADNPDVMELFKFTVTEGAISDSGSGHQQQQRSEQPHGHGSLPGAPEALPDRAADEISSNDAQFADLHNRLQALQHQLADMNAQFDTLSQKLESKAGEIISRIPDIPQNALVQLSSRVENTERLARAILSDVEGRDYKQHFTELNEAMANVRGGLTPESLGKIVTASAPSMGFFLSVIIAVQILLAAAYVFYKRRRANAPKKYL